MEKKKKKKKKRKRRKRKNKKNKNKNKNKKLVGFKILSTFKIGFGISHYVVNEILIFVLLFTMRKRKNFIYRN